MGTVMAVGHVGRRHPLACADVRQLVWLDTFVYAHDARSCINTHSPLPGQTPPDRIRPCTCTQPWPLGVVLIQVIATSSLHTGQGCLGNFTMHAHQARTSLARWRNGALSTILRRKQCRWRCP